MKKLNFNPKNFILELTKQQVQPALGCTEIGIVVLAAAKAAQLLSGKIASAEVKVSTCIYRNDERVGVPRLGICGIATIAAAGFVLKNPEKKLDCISSLDKEKIKLAKALGASNKIKVTIDYDAKPVYTFVKAVDNKKNVATVLIEDAHHNIVSAKLNGKETLKTKNKSCTVASCGINFDKHVDDMPLEKVYQTIKTMKLQDLLFLEEGIKMNDVICNFGLKHPYKNSLTEALLRVNKNGKNLFGFAYNHWTTKVILATCAGVEARMYGSTLPVMTSANSGDHGLTVFIPLSVHAKAIKLPKIKLLQSLLFAHYITWYIKSHVGHLCGMCGCSIAAGPGAICGLAYQLGWSWNKINDVLNAHLCSQINVMCDGAKPSCAYKCVNTLINGFFAMHLVAANGKIQSKDGIVYKNVEQTIKNYQFVSQKTLKNISDTSVKMLDNMRKFI